MILGLDPHHVFLLLFVIFPRLYGSKAAQQGHQDKVRTQLCQSSRACDVGFAFTLRRRDFSIVKMVVASPTFPFSWVKQNGA